MAGEPEILRERGRSLEEEFFRREDARLRENLRQAAQRASAREALERASGIKNPAVIDRLIALALTDREARRCTASSRWRGAYGRLTPRRAAIPAVASGQRRFAPATPARGLLEGWLTPSPTLRKTSSV